MCVESTGVPFGLFALSPPGSAALPVSSPRAARLDPPAAARDPSPGEGGGIEPRPGVVLGVHRGRHRLRRVLPVLPFLALALRLRGLRGAAAAQRRRPSPPPDRSPPRASYRLPPPPGSPRRAYPSCPEASALRAPRFRASRAAERTPRPRYPPRTCRSRPRPPSPPSPRSGSGWASSPGWFPRAPARVARSGWRCPRAARAPRTSPPWARRRRRC